MWKPRPAATPEELDRLHRAMPEVPDTLVRILQSSNGGEGDLGLQPRWLQLFSIDQLIEMSNDEFYCTEFPYYLFFGSNGSLELLALDKQNEFGVVMIDPIAGANSSIKIAPSLSEFEAAIGKEYHQDA